MIAPAGLIAFLGLYAGIMAPALSAEHAARGEERVAMQEYSRAVEDYSCALALDPGSVRARTGRGMARVWRGVGIGLALEDFNAAIGSGNAPAEAYQGRGLAKAALGHDREAVQDFDRALELDSRPALAYGGRGQALAALGSWEESEKALREAWRRSERDVLALALGRVLGLRGKSDESRKFLMRAVELATLRISPEAASARAHLLRAEARIALSLFGNAQEGEGAKEDLAEAARIEPEGDARLLVQAELSLLERQDGDAIQKCDQALRLNPENTRAYSLRAFARARQGEGDAAEEDARRALEANDRDALALFARAIGLAGRRETASADEAVREALRLSPPGWPFRSGLLELQARLGSGR